MMKGVPMGTVVSSFGANSLGCAGTHVFVVIPSLISKGSQIVFNIAQVREGCHFLPQLRFGRLLGASYLI